MIQDFFESGFMLKRLLTLNEDGIMVEKYYSAGPMEGRMRPLTGSEARANEKLNYNATHRFYTDFFGIRVTDIIERGGEEFHVTHIQNPMEMHQYLQVDCELRDNTTPADVIVMSD